MWDVSHHILILFSFLASLDWWSLCFPYLQETGRPKARPSILSWKGQTAKGEGRITGPYNVFVFHLSSQEILEQPMMYAYKCGLLNCQNCNRIKLNWYSTFLCRGEKERMHYVFIWVILFGRLTYSPLEAGERMVYKTATRQMEAGCVAVQRAALSGSAWKQEGSSATPLRSFLGLVMVNVFITKLYDQTEQVSSHWKGLRETFTNSRKGLKVTR